MNASLKANTMRRTELNTASVADAIKQALRSLRDMTPVYNDISEYMVGATKQRFLRSEAPDGSKWQPKSNATQRLMKRPLSTSSMSTWPRI